MLVHDAGAAGRPTALRAASLGRRPGHPRAAGRPAGRAGRGQYARAVTPEQLQDVVRTAVAAVVGRGELPVDVPDEVVVERPKNREHGDYATNVALRLAKPAGRPPREVAELLAARAARAARHRAGRRRRPRLPQHHPRRGRAGPDRRAGGHRRPRLRAHRRAGRPAAEPRVRLGQPDRPGAHSASTRWAAVGDALGRLLEASGAEVSREYYVNDAGAQIERFARSLQAAALGRPVPEDGYQGDYIETSPHRSSPPTPGCSSGPRTSSSPVFARAGRRG